MGPKKGKNRVFGLLWKIESFDFARNGLKWEAHYGWLTFCANPVPGKILILDIYSWKLSTNQITRFFKLLYLLNHSTVLFNFCINIEYHKTFKMMSLFWKNAYLPPKRIKRSKTGQSSLTKSTFLYIAQNWLIGFFWYFA